jgi:hypothetical protein
VFVPERRALRFATRIEFEARLALGEIEHKAGQTAKSRATLTSLAQEAKAKGFNLIAAKAGGASK